MGGDGNARRARKVNIVGCYGGTHLLVIMISIGTGLIEAMLGEVRREI
jgi:hypothetical protein